MISGRWRRAGGGLDESAPGHGVNIGLTTLLLGHGAGDMGVLLHPSATDCAASCSLSAVSSGN